MQRVAATTLVVVIPLKWYSANWSGSPQARRPTSSARESTPTFSKMRERCFFAVAGVILAIRAHLGLG